MQHATALAYDGATFGVPCRVISLRAAVPKVPADQRTTWVHMATEGEWMGHADGPFELTAESFARAVQNFRRRQTPLDVKYGHPSSAARKSGQPIPSAGKITDLQVRREGGEHQLWGLVTFTPRSARMVEDEEINFCSVVIALASSDIKSGEEIGTELLELGLTDDPAIDGLHPITLTRRVAGSTRSLSMDIDIKGVVEAIEALKKPSREDLMKCVEAALLMQEAQAGESADEPAPEIEELTDPPVPPVPPGEVPPKEMSTPPPVPGPSGTTQMADAAPGNPPPAVIGPEMVATKLMEWLALGDPAAVLAWLEEHRAEIEALGKGAPSGTPSDAVGMSRRIEVLEARGGVKDAKIEKLTADLATANAKVVELTGKVETKRNLSIEQKVDAAIEAGHILPTGRDRMIRLGRADVGILDEELGEAAKKPAVPTTPVVSAAPPALSGGDPYGTRNEDEVRLVKRMGRSPKHVVIDALERFRRKTEGATGLNGRA